MTSKIVVNNIEPDAGISTVTVNGDCQATTFKGATGTFTGNLNVAGVLTYEDVTNVDSVGVITARNGVKTNVSPAITIRDGTTEKGFIGFNGNDPFVGRKNGVGLLFQNNKIRPVDGDDGSGINNTIDIGEPTFKFKDGYFAGNIFIGTAGKGIDYSAQTASGIAGVSVSSELLDHYEEGTFTPFLSAASSAPTVSYGAERGGRYTRIGNMVFYSIGLNIASYSGGSGDAYIGGFPYIGAGTPGWDGAHVFRDTAAIGLNSRTNTVGGWIGDTAVAGYPVFYIQSMSGTSNFGAAAVQANSMTTGRLTLHGQYHIG